MTIRGLVIGGVHSGVGKTTLTLGLLAALRRRGLTVQPFKVGPDFIDPGHHWLAAGRWSTNLDGWLLSRAENLAIFARRCWQAELAVVEGVMGLFDGYDGLSEAGSTAQLAKWLGLPVLLVVDARSLARSAAALVHGYATFDPDLQLLGVVFNRVGSARHLHYLEQALSLVPGVEFFGGLPRLPDLAIPERHLGLVTVQEWPWTPAFRDRLADLVEEHLDLDRLLACLPAVKIPEIVSWQSRQSWASQPPVRLAVAQDQAFCFYYQENLEYLEQAGAELVYFSPLQSRKLPPGVAGLYLGGGYPEVFARDLAENETLRLEIRHQAAAGLPIYAECGGLMFLSQGLTTSDGQHYPMVGVLPCEVRMLPRFKALGYREVRLAQDCLLGPAGLTLRGHEFHYSEITTVTTDSPPAYRVTPRQPGEATTEGFWRPNVLASYIHLHFGSNPAAAQYFVACCRRYQDSL